MENFKGNLGLYDSFVENITTNGNGQWARLAMNNYYYSYENAKYKVSLWGKTSDGESVELASMVVDEPTELTEASSENFSYTVKKSGKDVKITNSYEYKNYQAEFTEQGNEWSDYFDITIRVIRIGNINRYGKGHDFADKTNVTWNEKYLFILPRYTEVSYEQKQPLQTLMAPSISIFENEDGTTTDSLLYNVSFGLVNNEDMLPDVGGYLVEVKEVVTNSDEVLPEEADILTTYYLIKEKGMKLTNYDLEDDATVIDVSKNFTNENGYGNAVIDLYDFSNKTVEISVRALARDNDDHNKPTKYTHGQFSAAREVLILEALKVPDMSSFVVTEIKDPDAEEAKTIDYVLQYKDFDEEDSDFEPLYKDVINADVNVDIQAAIDVFTDASEVNPIATIYSKDKPLTFTVFSKNNTLGVASTSLISNEVTKNVVFEQYAGYWMRITIKAHSDSIIDSKWTDDVLGAANEDRYLWIKIPEMLIEDTSSISKIDTEEVKYSVDNETNEATVKQQSFNILIDPNMDEYSFNFKLDKNAGNAMAPGSMYIEKLTSELEDEWYLVIDSNRTELSSDKTLIPDFYNEIKVKETDNEFTFICHAYVSIISDQDTGNQYIQLIVPDALQVSVDTNGDNSFDVVQLATINNDNGFIALETLEFVTGLNKEHDKQKDIITNSNKCDYKKEELGALLEKLSEELMATNSSDNTDASSDDDGDQTDNMPVAQSDDENINLLELLDESSEAQDEVPESDDDEVSESDVDEGLID